MNRLLNILLSLTLLIVLTGCVTRNDNNQSDQINENLPEITEEQKVFSTIVSFPDSPSVSVEAEIASDFNSRMIGLMNKKEMDTNKGMLFIFNSEQELSFWMKNTYIPLDIIFLSADKTINTIHKNTKPLDETKKYISDKESLYVLEVNANFTDENNIRVGDKVLFEVPSNLKVE